MRNGRPIQDRNLRHGLREAQRQQEALMRNKQIGRAAFNALARDLIDKGLLIEAGFAGLRAQASRVTRAQRTMHPDAPPDQVREMRMAFFAGAQHVFGSIMQALDPGAEPSEADFSRMDKIAAELHAFIEQWTNDLRRT